MWEISRLLTVIAVGVIGCLSGTAANTVTRTLLNDSVCRSKEMMVDFRSVSNENDCTRLTFDLKGCNAPFSIYKVEWINCGRRLDPVESFSLLVNDDEAPGRSSEWHISIDFPFVQEFDEYSDALILTTDRGTVRCATFIAGELKRSVNMLEKDYAESERSHNADMQRSKSLLYAIISSVLFISVVLVVVIRHKFISKKKEIDELSVLIADRNKANIALKAKVDALYGSRLDTLNMLCNEYFDKRDSDKLRPLIYNEVEKHILNLKDAESVDRLQVIVNEYLDNILVRVKTQIPELHRNDIRFLTYLYAGFSPRAVCIFTDIKIKNFYNKRSRLKDRILSSKAIDKEFFVSKM